MSTLRKVSFILFSAALLLLLTMSVIYLTRSEFMPYHSDAVEASWDQVPRGYQTLILGFIYLSGGSFLAVSLAIVLLLLIPFRKGEKWAARAILLVGMTEALTALGATLMIKFTTPADPPWAASLAACLLLIGGYVLTLFNKPKSEPSLKS